MDRELQRHERFKLPLSLLFIDIDRFKAINDTLGHEAGDRVLQYVARFLKRHIREADYVFRWGGDEFLVLITCTEDEARRKAAVLKAEFDAAPEARGTAAGHRPERRLDRGAAGHDGSDAARERSRRADVPGQGTRTREQGPRRVDSDVSRRAAGSLIERQPRIARRPLTRRPMPSATVAFCSAP